MPILRYTDISLGSDDVKQVLDEAISTDIDLFHENAGTDQIFLYHVNNDMYEGTACITKPSSVLTPTFLSIAGQVSSRAKNKLYSSKYIVNPVYRGWKKANLVLNFMVLFGLQLIHRSHQGSKNLQEKLSLFRKCSLCILINNTDPKIHNAITSYQFIESESTTEDMSAESTPFIFNPDFPVPESISRFSMEDDFFRESLCVGSSVTDSKLNISTKVDAETQLYEVIPIIDTENPFFLQVTEKAKHDITAAYWNEQASEECLEHLSKSELEQYQQDKATGVLYYKGRLGNDQKIAVQDLDLLNLNFLDSSEITFHAPCLLAHSPIFYSFAIHCHFDIAPHSGSEGTLAQIAKRFHVIQPRKVLGKLLKDCIKCKIIRKKVLEHEMAKHDSVRLTLAPPFTFLQIDLAQPFSTKTRSNSRQTMKCPSLVVCCLSTGGIGVYMLENWSTESVLNGLTRHSNRYGVPAILYVDSGSQLKILDKMTFSIQTLSHSLQTSMNCKLVVSAPKAHVSQGRIERRIGILKDMLSKLSEPKFLMSFLAWETLFSSISNHLNDLPIARASSRSVIRPEYSILTPNRCLLGRNNSRSLAGPLVLTSKPSTMFERALDAQETFYKLLHKQMFLLIPRPKWFKSDQLSINDIVLFFLDDSPFKERSRPWHYGRVINLSGNQVTLEYTIGSSTTKKSISRTKRTCCRIASEEELCFNSSKHMDSIVSGL